jgi:hypothetical protein
VLEPSIKERLVESLQRASILPFVQSVSTCVRIWRISSSARLRQERLSIVRALVTRDESRVELGRAAQRIAGAEAALGMEAVPVGQWQSRDQPRVQPIEAHRV